MKFIRDERGMLFVVSAPSGGGKTSLCKEVIKRLPNFEHGVSYTTRKRRPTEVDGKDYHFVSKEKFMDMVEADEFVEYAFVHGNYYGTLIQNFQQAKKMNTHLVMEIDVQGGKAIKKKYPQESILIFLLPPTFETLEKRIKARGTENQEQINTRLQTAKLELLVANEYDYRVINDDTNRCAKEIMHILKGSILDEEERTKRYH